MKEWTSSSERNSPVQRHSDHLHLGTQQTAHIRRAADRHPGLPVAQTPHPDLGAERLPAAADRELPAPATQGATTTTTKYVTQLPDRPRRSSRFRKPAAVHQRSLTAGSSKTTSATTGDFAGKADADLFPAVASTAAIRLPDLFRTTKSGKAIFSQVPFDKVGLFYSGAPMQVYFRQK